MDTGPILLQKSCKISPDDTVDSLYHTFLYPEGVKMMAEAVNLVSKGNAPKIPQGDLDASYDMKLNKKELQQIDWSKSAKEVHNFIRGLDSIPGAWTTLDGEEAQLFGSSLWDSDVVLTNKKLVDLGNVKGIIHDDGLLIKTIDDRHVNVKLIRIVSTGKTIHASQYGQKLNTNSIDKFTEEELITVNNLRRIWRDILKTNVEKDTDFFNSGERGAFQACRIFSIKYYYSAEWND